MDFRGNQGGLAEQDEAVARSGATPLLRVGGGGASARAPVTSQSLTRPAADAGTAASFCHAPPRAAFSGPVLLDVSRLIWRASTGHHPTGIDRACLAYVDHYQRRARAVIQYRGWRAILNQTRSRDLFTLLLGAESDRFVEKLKLLALKSPLAWHKPSKGAGLFYLHTAHTGVEKGSFGRWSLHSGVRPIFLVHDLIPLTHSEYCREGESERHAQRMITMLRTAHGIICNSQATLEELRAYARTQNLTMPPACVAWLGSSSLAVPADPLVIPGAGAGAATTVEKEGPFFLMLGTVEARKNHLLILHIWEQMVKRHGPRAPKLKIVGRRGWECGQTTAMLDRCQALSGHVEELADCPDEALTQLLRGCRALLFPSHVEGFGLPLVEAMAQGTPVIASDLPVFRELAGDIPDYVDPIDGLGWMRVIGDFAREDSARRAAQISRIRAYQPVGWSSHFDVVDGWLATL